MMFYSSLLIGLSVAVLLQTSSAFLIRQNGIHAHGLSTTSSSSILSMENIRSGLDGTLRPSPQIFETDGWKRIENDLDRFPIWTVATADGDPLAYTVTVPAQSTYTVPFFWCDVSDALQELENSRANTQLDGLDIIPFPLGTAFKMWVGDSAVIVPSRASILQAGQGESGASSASNSSPIGQQVPMWTCLEISEEDEETGRPLLPIFMALDDANAAVTEAVRTDGGKLDDFEVVCLSLNGAIEQLVTVPEETPSFHFIPPSTSMDYIEESVY